MTLTVDQIIAIGQYFGPPVVALLALASALLNRRKLDELHVILNSRLTELLVANRRASHAEGLAEGTQHAAQLAAAVQTAASTAVAQAVATAAIPPPVGP